ncbi:MAG: ester cyclase [Chloroflexota bacterium]
MNKEWATSWIKSFGSSPEEGVSFYADEFIFEDVPLDQDIRNDKAALFRCFGPYSNKDPNNGIGIHNFEVEDYIGDENSGFIVWRWEATDCASFIGLPTNGKTIHTRGITGHIYKNGKVVREWTHSDQATILAQLGYPVQLPHYWEEGWTPEQG